MERRKETPKEFFYYMKKPDGDYELKEPARFNTGVYPEKTVFHSTYQLDMNGWLTLLPGYVWDGASGPAIDTDTNMRASAVHDVMITMIQERKLPSTRINKMRVDGLYWRLAREDSMCWIRAILHLLVIQWNHWERKIKNVIPG